MSSDPQLFSGPDWVPPRDVERIWKGKDRHYANGTNEMYDRARALWQLSQDGGPKSESIIDRAVTAYGPNGRVVRGLLPKWPILKYQQRPWLAPAAPQDTDELVREAIEVQDLFEQVRYLRQSEAEMRALVNHVTAQLAQADHVNGHAERVLAKPQVKVKRRGAWGEFERGADWVWRVSIVSKAAADRVGVTPADIIDKTLAQVMQAFGPSISYEARLAAVEALAVGESREWHSNRLQHISGEHLWNSQRWTRLDETHIHVALKILPPPDE